MHKVLTMDEVTGCMAEIFAQRMNPVGTYNVTMGAGGKAMFDKAIKREIALQHCNSEIDAMERDKKIDKEQAATLRKMLNTEDDWDFDLAEEVIKNLRNVCLK